MADQGQGHKISDPEAVFVIIAIGLVDLVELALVFFGLDDFWISDAIAFPLTQIYLRMKGVRGTYELIGNIIELIPYAGWIPFRTLGMIATIYVDRHPRLEAVAGAVGQIAQKGNVSGPAAANKEVEKAAGEIDKKAGEIAEQGKGMKRVGEAGTPAASKPAAEESRESEKKTLKDTEKEDLEWIKKLKEPMEKIPEPAKNLIPKKPGVGVDDETGEINLKMAA